MPAHGAKSLGTDHEGEEHSGLISNSKGEDQPAFINTEHPLPWDWPPALCISVLVLKY